MSYKVVRRNGEVVAAGPNESYFKPVVEPGDILSIEESLPIDAGQYEYALDRFLDAAAQKDRWTNRFTFVARAGYPNKWRAKATAFGTWMDDCNAQAYDLMQRVKSGEVPMPTVEEFIASLPEFVFNDA